MPAKPKTLSERAQALADTPRKQGVRDLLGDLGDLGSITVSDPVDLSSLSELDDDLETLRPILGDDWCDTYTSLTKDLMDHLADVDFEQVGNLPGFIEQAQSHLEDWEDSDTRDTREEARDSLCDTLQELSSCLEALGQ